MLGKCSSGHVKCSFETLAKFHSKSLNFLFEVQKGYKKHFFRKTSPPDFFLCARRKMFWHSWLKFSLNNNEIAHTSKMKGKIKHLEKKLLFHQNFALDARMAVVTIPKKNYSPKRRFFCWKSEEFWNIVQGFKQGFSSECSKAL